MITVEEEHLQRLGKRASVDGQVSKAMAWIRTGHIREAIYALAFLPLQELETKVVDFAGDPKQRRSTVAFHLRGMAKRLEEIAGVFE